MRICRAYPLFPRSNKTVFCSLCFIYDYMHRSDGFSWERNNIDRDVIKREKDKVQLPIYTIQFASSLPT